MRRWIGRRNGWALILLAAAFLLAATGVNAQEKKKDDGKRDREAERRTKRQTNGEDDRAGGEATRPNRTDGDRDVRRTPVGRPDRDTERRRRKETPARPAGGAGDPPASPVDPSARPAGPAANDPLPPARDLRRWRRKDPVVPSGEAGTKTKENPDDRRRIVDPDGSRPVVVSPRSGRIPGELGGGAIPDGGGTYIDAITGPAPPFLPGGMIVWAEEMDDPWAITLPGGTILPDPTDRALVEELQRLVDEGRGDEPIVCLLQTAWPLDWDERDDLFARGVVFYRKLNDRAFIVDITPEIVLEELVPRALFRWIGLHLPGYKYPPVVPIGGVRGMRVWSLNGDDGGFREDLRVLGASVDAYDGGVYEIEAPLDLLPGIAGLWWVEMIRPRPAGDS